jgi:hypothetical protein
MTKTIKLQNADLVPVGNFLGKLKLKKKASRGRTKLIKLLEAKNKEYNEDREEIRDPYFEHDDKGERVTKDNAYVLKDLTKGADLNKELTELAKEKAVVEFTEYSEKFQALYDALTNYQYELADADAVLYDLVLDELENNFEKEND